MTTKRLFDPVRNVWA